MPRATLELLAHDINNYSSLEEISLPIVIHVHKRIERFVYKNKILDKNIPISYLETPSYSPDQNILVSDLTYRVPENSFISTQAHKPIIKLTGNSASLPYKKVVITNQTYVSDTGKEKPLWWKHKLPKDTAEVSLLSISRGNKQKFVDGFVADLDQQVLFTNYQNHYDLDTGSYTIYYVVATSASGEVTSTLLNTIPVVEEATWEDIDLTTGKLTDSYPTYSFEESGNGFTFYFSQTSTYYIKLLEDEFLTLKKPQHNSRTNPWFLSVKNASIVADVNGKIRKYSVPEYLKQNFIPYLPYRYAVNTPLRRINRSLLVADGFNLKIDPATGFNIDILIYDSDGVLVKALSTDVSKEGARHQETDVFYDTTAIESWDNRHGIIQLNIKLHRSWTAQAFFYYEATDYEYTLLDFNPFLNKEVTQFLYVFYVIPDTYPDDRSVHYLKVDSHGRIVYTSQSQGVSYPNLQLRNADNSFNEDTVIGMLYKSDLEIDTFTSLFTANHDNDYGYLVLGEVFFRDTANWLDFIDIDVRREGDSLVRETIEDAVTANPKLLQSYLVYGEDGQEVPINSVSVIQAPVSLLEEYGGSFSKEEAEKLLLKHHPAYNAALIEWEYPAVELTGDSTTSSQVDLTWTWEGPGFTYSLYRTSNLSAEWDLIYEISPSSEGEISYSDTNLTSGEVVYYKVQVSDSNYQYPAAYTLGIKVR